jgi:hypothetical protein
MVFTSLQKITFKYLKLSIFIMYLHYIFFINYLKFCVINEIPSVRTILERKENVPNLDKNSTKCMPLGG